MPAIARAVLGERFSDRDRNAAGIGGLGLRSALDVAEPDEWPRVGGKARDLDVAQLEVPGVAYEQALCRQRPEEGRFGIVAFTLMPEPVEAPAGPDLLAFATMVLGKRSDRLEALLIVARGGGRSRAQPGAGLSVRERCRERVGVTCSRMTLYRRAKRGATIVAERLNAEGINVPDGADRD